LLCPKVPGIEIIEEGFLVVSLVLIRLIPVVMNSANQDVREQISMLIVILVQPIHGGEIRTGFGKSAIIGTDNFTAGTHSLDHRDAGSLWPNIRICVYVRLLQSLTNNCIGLKSVVCDIWILSALIEENLIFLVAIWPAIRIE
jgi:hypothetical protein